MQDPLRLEHALSYWNKYHEALDEAERLYHKAMTAVYLNIQSVICRVNLHDMGFTVDKIYKVVGWTSEGLSVANDEGITITIAAVPVGDQPTSDRWFRQNFSVVDYCCACERD